MCAGLPLAVTDARFTAIAGFPDTAPYEEVRLRRP
jgi:hypothetical protein